MPEPRLVILGSVALDTLASPFGRAERTAGGSATYAALAASLFTSCGILGVAGEDFPQDILDLFRRRGVDVEGLEIRPQAKSFHWQGSYGYDLNVATTLKTELNVLADYQPKVPPSWRKASYLLLGNMHPATQLSVLSQMEGNPHVFTDTMNFWIESERKSLLEVIGRSHVLLVNDAEARQLMETSNLLAAGRGILSLGPQMAVIKKGEHGSLLFVADEVFSLPAFPLEQVKDPTGAGDTFAGTVAGFVGYQDRLDFDTLRKALVLGTLTATFTVSAFGIEGLRRVTAEALMERYLRFRRSLVPAELSEELALLSRQEGA